MATVITFLKDHGTWSEYACENGGGHRDVLRIDNKKAYLLTKYKYTLYYQRATDHCRLRRYVRLNEKPHKHTYISIANDIFGLSVDDRKKKVVDHVSHNPMDNRMDYMRVGTFGENNTNRRIARKYDKTTLPTNITKYPDGTFRVDIMGFFCGVRTTLQGALNLKEISWAFYHAGFATT